MLQCHPSCVNTTHTSEATSKRDFLKYSHSNKMSVQGIQKLCKCRSITLRLPSKLYFHKGPEIIFECMGGITVIDNFRIFLKFVNDIQWKKLYLYCRIFLSIFYFSLYYWWISLYEPEKTRQHQEVTVNIMTWFQPLTKWRYETYIVCYSVFGVLYLNNTVHFLRRPVTYWTERLSESLTEIWLYQELR